MKISVIGAGRVGSTAAFLLVERGLCDELVLVDVNKDRAVGEAMDLKHGASATHRVRVIGTDDYSLTKNSDITIITAGIPRKPGESRLDLAKKNADIIKDITKKLVKYTNGIFLVVSNPVDIMAYLVYKESGINERRVFGLGTMLDTLRFRSILADLYLATDDVYIIGEHGDSMLPVLSWVKEIDKDKYLNLFEGVRKAAADVIRLKGATFYAPAVAIAEVVESIVKDKKRNMPLSVYHDEFDIYISNIVSVGRDGVRKSDVRLNAEEKERFLKSVRIIEKEIKKL
ncbi:MAG: malate dehydrogenase [Methanobacteriota archaeon]|nr:MAG: malate dehydrogenase [Euryarchaeota archaeon]